ncbi:MULTISPECIES: alpha/beta hydrolase [unclassified Amycolatopsis]|uniref:alpha/beta fold hydrolase n=1 Tax=unclassified Amycolatopsis TaxID=2618356 RepID=UPI00287445CD|nr:MULTISPECIES: alpha/beta hydrolase [unclassified Amycolatopsis]MDS0139191.1 alpha/beta hydrolase [Amycolatopsis sp. 505]MDS0144423.1 alpha/beta hydrolase [Amycolatopsis sp. CM201R]
MTASVTSPDGTVIGFETLGDGPPMVLVHGTGADHTRWAAVRDRLAERYRLHLVDRRGRGLSRAEAADYDIRREGEDIAAVAEAAGGDVYLLAHSYGALCALEAVLTTEAVSRLVAYEPPRPEPGGSVVPPEARARMREADNPEQILEIFLQEALRVDVEAMRRTPVWRSRVAAAHTIPRELDVVENLVFDARLGEIAIPVRLFAGTESPGYLRLAAHAVAELIPTADVVAMHGQAHQAMDFDPGQFTEAVFAFGPA